MTGGRSGGPSPGGPSLARRGQTLYIRPMARATRHFSLSLQSPLLATGSLPLGGLLLRLAR